DAQFVVRRKERALEPRFEVGYRLTAMLAYQPVGPVAVDELQMPRHRKADDAGAEIAVRQPLVLEIADHGRRKAARRRELRDDDGRRARRAVKEQPADIKADPDQAQ